MAQHCGGCDRDRLELFQGELDQVQEVNRAGVSAERLDTLSPSVEIKALQRSLVLVEVPVRVMRRTLAM